MGRQVKHSSAAAAAAACSAHQGAFALQRPGHCSSPQQQQQHALITWKYQPDFETGYGSNLSTRSVFHRQEAGGYQQE